MNAPHSLAHAVLPPMSHAKPLTSPPRLGEQLCQRGALGSDQLRIALLEQQKRHRPLGRILVELGFVSENLLLDTLSSQLGHRSIRLDSLLPDPAALALLPRELARQHHCFPLRLDPLRQELHVALAQVHDLPAQDRLRNSLSDNGADALQIVPVLAGEADIAQAIDRHYGHPLAIDDILQEIEQGPAARSNGLHGESSGQPVVRLVDSLIHDAVRAGASDLHFEPEAGFLRLRYRIDGLLQPIRCLHASHWPAMAVRLKILSGMNIAETRAPQDGHFSLLISGRPIDFRAASHPTLHGENLVLRILDRQKGIVPLEQLGLDAWQQARLHELLQHPEGLTLLTGPTGSGKTTTLYALLQQLDHERLNVMTLEDPVEYPLPLLRQTSLAEAHKLDFASGIRSLLRQDPDIILVGEIRDQATASMAFRAAMTGHQVFSTLHSNSALGALPRLLDIGIPPGLLAGNLTAIVAQRLLRRLCPHCRQAEPAGPEDYPLLGLHPDQPAPTIYRAQPSPTCPVCRGSGYRGRLAAMEILQLDEELDDLIASGASLSRLRSALEARGHRGLAEAAAAHVRNGDTSPEEVLRVIGRRRPAAHRAASHP